MKKAPLRPQLHFFVCCNRRQDSPLGPGCSERGDAVYAALKKRVQQRGEIASTWVTQTGCLGICPAKGATVAIYPEGAIATEVEPEDLDLLGLPLPDRTRKNRIMEDDEANVKSPSLEAELETLLDEMESLQRKKVTDLARRLKPGLTAEDLRNPHDFPELDDTDWHYEDGVLTGIQSVRAAVSRLQREREDPARRRESSDGKEG